MVDLKLAVETPPSFMERVMSATPRLLLAAAFIVIGLTKFGSHSAWIPIFDRIGFGQWFRYLAGAMQLGGGALALFPGTAMVGGLLIACTMAGAVVTDLFVLRAGPLAIVPFALFALSGGVALQSWAAQLPTGD